MDRQTPVAMRTLVKDSLSFIYQSHIYCIESHNPVTALTQGSSIIARVGSLERCSALCSSSLFARRGPLVQKNGWCWFHSLDWNCTDTLLTSDISPEESTVSVTLDHGDKIAAGAVSCLACSVLLSLFFIVTCDGRVLGLLICVSLSVR